MTLSSPDLGSAITVGGALPPRRLPAGWVITAARAVFGSSSPAAIEREASGLAPVAGVWPVVMAEPSAGTSTECASASAHAAQRVAIVLNRVRKQLSESRGFFFVEVEPHRGARYSGVLPRMCYC